MHSNTMHNLTTGSILKKLLALSLPVMGSNLVQMAYNLTDMFWLGRLGGLAVAASGTVGTYMWLSLALQNFGARGAEIGVSQQLGRRNTAAACGYGQSAVTLSLVLGLLFGGFLFFARSPLIGFFGIQQAAVVQGAKTYLAVISIGIPFTYVSTAIMGCLAGSGNTLTSFYISSLCLGLNMLLDPILIFTAGLGIAGAGIATVLSQVLCCVLLVLALRRAQPVFACFRLFGRARRSHLAHIFRWAAPIALESFLFTFLIMLISRFIAGFGAQGIAVQRVGSQIEGLSWLVATGFASAFTAFIGQNFGGGYWLRISRGVGLATASMACWGLLCSALMFFDAQFLFGIFLPQDAAFAAAGAAYLRILALCQVPNCLEFTAAGAFHGLGHAFLPSAISIGVNAARVVAAWFLCQTSLGLSGIWWAISLGACLRGVLVYGAFLLYRRRLPAPAAGTG